ncbi:Uncharacterized protein OBRU01_20113 [Operophtera brumata]|uniref:Peptidase M12B domain-containing protein n=1 Tax=Operophtera brumata TaxID=104452 RepID=A0A0L7KNI5_OPEBR|nr:Uncharacterized protein OBRU01_20113 [Operophtera brumata]
MKLHAVWSDLRKCCYSLELLLLCILAGVVNEMGEAHFEIAHLNHHKRRKRSLLYDDQDLVGLKKHLHVKPTPRSLLDPQFLLIRRQANATEVVEHSDEIDRCYYRSEHAALYACGDVVRTQRENNTSSVFFGVSKTSYSGEAQPRRGVVKSNDSYYYIHPLPERFHNVNSKPHVIVKRKPNPTDDERTCIERHEIPEKPVTAKPWSKHRRKRHAEVSRPKKLEDFKLNIAHRNKTIDAFIEKLAQYGTLFFSGLAPVAGMCTVTSSCTVNEGRHFESVYVVAHEIGHNLGMRHDGPLADNGCDPSAYIMSPTLGSGKITWSQCSKNYLQKFLDTIQARCLLDHGNSAGQLDHSAEGILPGERFDANQQCMLKYGQGSRHSAGQSLEDICRDLHCQRERYTWTSHPALEGTKCGEEMYCRGGECVERTGGTGVTLAGRNARGAWARWGTWSECASACLLDDTLAPAAAGVAVATRRCTRARNSNGNYCDGHDKKYQSCHAQQCNNVPRMTVREFADEICSRARDVDPDLIGTGLQRIDSDDVSSACAVWCDTRGGGYKSRGWALPDGTACSRTSPMFCISGICQVGSQWRPTSGCHYHCITPGVGVRLVQSASKSLSSIQLCHPDSSRHDLGCTQRKSPYQYATMVCSKYKERVRRLSGLGMQISPVLEDPDRPCRIACQDERVPHRFYLVNGQEGWFPLGTSCGKKNASYCFCGERRKTFRKDLRWKIVSQMRQNSFGN